MKKKIIAFHYSLKDPSGQLLETTQGNKPFKLLLGSGEMPRALEKVLVKLSPGDRKTVSLPAYEAYGYRDEDLVNKIPLNKLPIKVEVGDVLQVEVEGAPKKVMRVIEKTLKDVTLDGNHLWAGLDLVYEVEVVDVKLIN